VWDRPFSPFWALSQKGESEETKRGGKGGRAEYAMVSTISFIQANLQHCIAASRILTRRVGVKGIDMALIQEPWYHRDCISGLNIPGYTLFSAKGTEKPRACIRTKDKTAWMLPGFSCRDLIAVLIRYNEEGAERRLVVCCAYLPYDSEEPPPSKELEDLVRYCETADLYIVVGCDSMHIIACWVTPTEIEQGRPCWNF
jgi:hypothetical protein